MIQSTKDLLKFLQRRPDIRFRIRAPQDKTLLYAGRFFKPIWQEIVELKSGNSSVADKVILPEVLEKITDQDIKFVNLLAWVQEIDNTGSWREDGFIAWRVMSGLFASNAQGAVSFVIGSNISREEKVFAATELAVLARNPGIDAITKDILAYYDRCLRDKNPDMNFGFIAS